MLGLCTGLFSDSVEMRFFDLSLSLACVMGIPSFLAVCGASPLGSLDQCVWVKTCGLLYEADHLSQFGGTSLQVS